VARAVGGVEAIPKYTREQELKGAGRLRPLALKYPGRRTDAGNGPTLFL